MSGFVKKTGSWNTLSGVYAKRSSTWKSATAAFVKESGVWVQWFSAKITDSFNRIGATLGNSDTGNLWTAYTGDWYTDGASAKSDTTPSLYPHAAVNLGSTSGTVKAEVSQGVGVTFWVSSAGSWWAAYPTSTLATTSTCPNGNCSGTQSVANPVFTAACTTSSNTYSCGCTTSTTYIRTYANSSTDCPAPGTWNGFSGICSTPVTTTTSSCPNGGCGPTYTVSSTSSNCPSGACSGPCVTYTDVACSCTNTTTYAINLVSSVSGTVTSQATLATTSQVNAISAEASTAGVITVKGYTDTAYATLAGTITNTPTSPTKGTSYGIIKATSTTNQGSTADNFSANV